MTNIELSFLPAPAISVQITTGGALVLGQSYSLTCGVTRTENLSPVLTYQWTKNNGTQTQIQNDEANPIILSFSSLRLSDAGRYTCQATVSSLYLNSDITMMDTQDIILQSEFSYKIHVGLERTTLGNNGIYIMSSGTDGSISPLKDSVKKPHFWGVGGGG